MVILLRALTIGLCLLCTGHASDDFAQWLTARAVGGDSSLRTVSFAAASGESIESLAEAREWEINSVNLSPSRPPLPAQEETAYGSISFNGEDSYLAVRTWSDAGFSEQVSVGVWIKPDTSMFSDSRQSRFIVGKSASTEFGYHIGITERLEITVSLVGSNGFVGTRTAPVVEPYRWHHVGFSWDGSTLQIYIDGQAHGDPVQVSAPYRDYRAGALTFGRPAAVEGHYYRGEMTGFILLPEAFPAPSQP